MSGLNTGILNNIVNWSASPYDGSRTAGFNLPRTNFKVAANLGNLENQRCPTWTLCTSGRTGLHRTVLIPYDASWHMLPATTTRFASLPYTACATQPHGEACKELLCGSAASVSTADGSSVDWYQCSGPDCDAGAGTWNLTCQNQSSCTVSMADQDTFIVSLPVSLEAQVAADGVSADLGWAVANAGQ